MCNTIFYAVNYNGQELCSNDSLMRKYILVKSWNDIDRKKGLKKEELYDEESDEYKCWTNESPDYNTSIYDGVSAYNSVVYLPKGTIKTLTGKEITWNDEPIKIKM